MKTSQQIGKQMKHATNPEVIGTVTDVLFDMALGNVAYMLGEMTTPNGSAPVLFDPAVLAIEDDVVIIHEHPDDVNARVDAVIHKTDVSVDPSDLPTMFIGPFGNTFSPSMIAALFNARSASPRPPAPMDAGGVWMSELQNQAIRAHVSDVGRVNDVMLDDQFTVVTGIAITAADGDDKIIAPDLIAAERAADSNLLLTVVHGDEPSG